MRQAIHQTLPLFLAVVGGVICTIVIAVIVAVYSPQPTRWGFENEHTSGDPRYRSLASEASGSERIVVMTSSGLGYESRDVRYYDSAQVETTKYPPVKRRAFMTMLGWPNAAFATNARSIGLRFSNKLGPNSPSDDALLHDGRQTTMRILWAGLCLNSLLFATLFLMPWVFFRRKTTCWWRSRTVIAAVCFGLWFALLSAWGFDLVHHAVPHLPRDFEGYDDPIAFDSSVHSIDIPSSTEWDQFSGTATRSIGYRAWRFVFMKTVPDNRVSIVSGESLLSLGWPAICLKGPQISPWRAGGDPDPDETKRRHIVALMAMPVWWPGMLVNWMFYALIIVIVLRGPRALRRFYRRYRHQCPMCGYPIGAGSRCSECGHLHCG